MSSYRQRLVNGMAPALLGAVLRLLRITVRLRQADGRDLFARWGDERVIFAFWHNRLLALVLHAGGAPLQVLVSQSRDGELATRALAGWKIRFARGSATRGGARALLQMMRAHREGLHLGVVPDGPRGPRYEVKPGLLHLARATGARIIPLSCGVSRFRQLRSWDRLLVPLPFATVTAHVGEPLSVPREADEAEMATLAGVLGERLRALTERADREAGNRCPS